MDCWTGRSAGFGPASNPAGIDADRTVLVENDCRRNIRPPAQANSGYEPMAGSAWRTVNVAELLANTAIDRSLFQQHRPRPVMRRTGLSSWIRLFQADHGSGNDSLLGVSDTHIQFGGDGNDWVGASGSFNRLIGEAGDDYVAATGNANTLDGGPGNDQMVAAAGHSANRYVFRPGSGQDAITGFEGTNFDTVDLRGFGLADFAALDPYMSQVGARHRHRAQRRRHPDAQEHQRGHAGGRRFHVRLSEAMFFRSNENAAFREAHPTYCSLSRQPTGLISGEKPRSIAAAELLLLAVANERTPLGRAGFSY